MKLSTNQIRELLESRPQFQKHIINRKKAQTGILRSVHLSEMEGIENVTEKIEDSHGEIGLHLIAEAFYVLQWMNGFNVVSAIEFYTSFDATKL